MASQFQNRRVETYIDIDDGFRELLMEMTYKFLLDRPSDAINFAIEFLTKKKKESFSICTEDMLPKKGSVPTMRQRRNSVIAIRPEVLDYDSYEPYLYPKTDAQRNKLMEAVRRASVFQKLDSLSTKRVLDAMRPMSVKKGQVIIEQGSHGEHFYVIERGTYEALLDEGNKMHVLKVYRDRGSFGDHSLVFEVPRLCTVRAATDGELWVLDRNTFRRVVLKGEYQRRKMFDTLLDNIPIFSFLSEDEKLSLADLLEVRRFSGGTCILREGDRADGMYFMVQGEVRVMRAQLAGSERELARLGTGDYFGELALITNRPRNASVYALTEVQAAFLSVLDFERVLGRYMDILRRNLQLFNHEVGRLAKEECITLEEFR